MHGPPKVGKTQFVDSMPGPVLFFATEFGHKYIRPKNKKYVTNLPPGSLGWKKFREVLKRGNIQKLGFKTVAVDTTSKLYDRALAFVCESNNWQHPGDESHGRGWHAVKVEFANGIAELATICNEIGATLVFIEHTSMEHVNLGVKEFDKAAVSMGKQARETIVATADHVFYLGYGEVDAVSLASLRHSGSVRKLWIFGDDSFEAGTRAPEIQIPVIEDIPKEEPYNYVIKKLNERQK